MSAIHACVSCFRLHHQKYIAEVTIADLACYLTVWVCPCVQGRGWDEGGVIVGPEYPTPLANPFSPPALVPAIGSKGAQPATAAAPIPTAADANLDLQLSVAMPRSVSPGESVSVTLEVVSLKSKAGGSPVEFTLDPIPASVSAAGEKQQTQTRFESEHVARQLTILVAHVTRRSGAN